MRSSRALACAFFLAGCLPTRSEIVTCTTDVECTSVRAGFTCDTRMHVCVCDGTSAFAGCARTNDGATMDADDRAAIVDADSPIDTFPEPECAIDADGTCGACTDDSTCSGSTP